tara:strand:+ start:66 stop:1256 length:1191 start_codon:yes stop_codon:yes gene_type:complete
MKKVILLTTGTLTDEDYQNLEISNYKKKQIQFEIWNFKFLYNLRVKNKKINCEVILSNFKHFKELIIKNKRHNLLFDVRTNFNLDSLKIFYYLTKYNCRFILHVGSLEGDLPENKKSFNFTHKIKSFFSNKLLLFVKNKFAFIFFKLNLHKLYKLKNADFVYVMGKKTYKNLKVIPLIGPDTKIVKGHHRNYDQYLILKEQKKFKNSKEKFALFIDQGVPMNPDWLKLGLNDVNIDEYYSSLRVFFLKVEKQLDIKIKISAHPRIDPKKIVKYFKEFEIIQGKTLELIYKSKFVISHDSTVLNFAIFLKKPILFIINDSLKNSVHDHLQEIKSFAQHLKKKVVNINKLDFKILKKELFVDNILYKKYIINNFKFAKSNISYSNKLIKILSYKHDEK